MPKASTITTAPGSPLLTDPRRAGVCVFKLPNSGEFCSRKFVAKPVHDGLRKFVGFGQLREDFAF